jgi:hypothetical protein
MALITIVLGTAGGRKTRHGSVVDEEPDRTTPLLQYRSSSIPICSEPESPEGNVAGGMATRERTTRWGFWCRNLALLLAWFGMLTRDNAERPPSWRRRVERSVTVYLLLPAP